jgi:hypothetical protein
MATPDRTGTDTGTPAPTSYAPLPTCERPNKTPRSASYTAWCGAGCIELTVWCVMSAVCGEKVYVDALPEKIQRVRTG